MAGGAEPGSGGGADAGMDGGAEPGTGGGADPGTGGGGGADPGRGGGPRRGGGGGGGMALALQQYCFTSFFGRRQAALLSAHPGSVVCDLLFLCLTCVTAPNWMVHIVGYSSTPVMRPGRAGEREGDGVG